MGSIDVYPPLFKSTSSAILGRKELLALSQVVTTDPTDITGLEVTVDVPLGATIKITAYTQIASSSAAGDRARLYIKEGATNLQQAALGMTINNAAEGITATWVGTPSAGVHTYKVAAGRADGDGVLTASSSATLPAFILVENISGGSGGSGPILLASTKRETQVTGITGTLTDIVSATVSVSAGRQLKITGIFLAKSTVSADEAETVIKQDGTIIQYAEHVLHRADADFAIAISVLVSPTAGTHTYLLQTSRVFGTGTITVDAGVGYPAFILVEDVTGTPAPGGSVWVDYVPTLTQSATPTKTVTYAYYTIVGDLVHVFGRLAITSSGTAANDIVIGLPVAAHSSLVGILPGSGFVNDTSAGTKHMGFPDIDTATTIKLSPATGTAPGFLGSVGFTAALASGDTVDFACVYRKA